MAMRPEDMIEHCEACNEELEEGMIGKCESCQGDVGNDDNGAIFTNEYVCACGTEWENIWSCGCDDRCPNCGTSISPYISDDGSVTDEQREVAYHRALANQDLFLCDNCGSPCPNAKAITLATGRICPACHSPT